MFVVEIAPPEFIQVVDILGLPVLPVQLEGLQGGLHLVIVGLYVVDLLLRVGLLLYNVVQLVGQLVLDCVVLVLHLQYILVEGHPVLEELVQLAVLLLLLYLLVLQ